MAKKFKDEDLASIQAQVNSLSGEETAPTKKSESLSDIQAQVNSLSGEQTPAAPISSRTTQAPTRPKVREKANALMRGLAGFEQGLTPLAVTAGKGAYGAATSKDGALARTSGAIEQAFDPNKTLTAKLTDKDYTADGFDYANAVGNVVGEIAKVVGTGGVGALDTIAKLGTKGAIKAIAKPASKEGLELAAAKLPTKEVIKGALTYIPAKAVLGNAAGVGGGNLGAAALARTDWYNQLSPEEQQQAMNVAATAGGLAGGALANKAGRAAVKTSDDLMGVRDKFAGKMGLPTYKAINEAQQHKKLEAIPGVNELMKKANLTPQEVTEHVKNAGMDVKDLSNDPVALGQLSQHILEGVKNPATGLMPKASEYAFKKEADIFDPETLSQEVPQELMKEVKTHGANYAKAFETATGEPLPGEFTGVNVPIDKNGEHTTPYAEGAGIAKIKPTGEVEINTHKNNEDLVANENGDTNKLFNNTIGAIHQLNQLPEQSEGLINARRSLTDSFTKQLDNLQEHKAGTATITNWLRDNVMGDETTQQPLLDSLKTDGKYDSAKVVDYMTKHPEIIMTSDTTRKGQALPGEDLTSSILTHVKDAELSDKTLEQYASGIAQEKQAIAQKNSTLNKINEDTNATQQAFNKKLSDTVFPVDPNNTKDLQGNLVKQAAATDEFTTSLSRAITEHDDLAGDPKFVQNLMSKANDSSADTKSRLQAIENLAPIFSHTGSLLKTPKGAGFGKVELAKTYKSMANDLKSQMHSLRMKEWVDNHPGEQPTRLDIAKIKKATDDAMAATTISIPGKVKGTEQSLALLTGAEGSTPTRALINMADTAAEHSRLYGLSAAKGRDMLGAGFARLEDARISNLPTSNMTIGDVLKLKQRLNKDKKYHKNAQGEYDQLTKQLDNILSKGLKSSKGDEAVASYGKVKNLQRAILDFRDNHPVLQKRILGGGDQEKDRDVFGMSPDFGERVADISQSYKELADLHGEAHPEIQAQAKNLIGASKARMIMGGPEGHKALADQLRRAGGADERVKWFGEQYKTQDWGDVLSKLAPELVKVGGGREGQPIVGTLGQRLLNNPDEKAAKFLAGLDTELNPNNKSHNRAAVEKMTDQFVSDVKTGINDHVQSTVQDAMKTGNIVTAMDKLKKFGGNIEELTKKSKILEDAFAKYPLGEVMRAVREGDDKATAKFIEDSIKSPTPVADLLSKSQVFENVQKKAIQMVSNDVDKARLNPADLSMKHFDDINNFKSDMGIARKLANIAIRTASVGFIREALGKKLEADKLGSPAQQRAFVTKKFLEFTMAPDNAEVLGGKTKAELIKEEFHKASAQLENLQNNKWQHLKRQNRALLQGSAGAAHNLISPARQEVVNEEDTRNIDLEKAKRSYMLPGY